MFKMTDRWNKDCEVKGTFEDLRTYLISGYAEEPDEYGDLIEKYNEANDVYDLLEIIRDEEEGRFEITEI